VKPKPVLADRLFEVKDVFGKRIRTTKAYWAYISETKHRVLEDKLPEVIETLRKASEVRRSQEDPKVFLYYRKINRHFMCVVVKHLNDEGFIITAYITGKLYKKGEKLWPKQSR